jgi:hypothetical protein
MCLYKKKKIDKITRKTVFFFRNKYSSVFFRVCVLKPSNKYGYYTERSVVNIHKGILSGPVCALSLLLPPRPNTLAIMKMCLVARLNIIWDFVT